MEDVREIYELIGVVLLSAYVRICEDPLLHSHNEVVASSLLLVHFEAAAEGAERFDSVPRVHGDPGTGK